MTTWKNEWTMCGGPPPSSKVVDILILAGQSNAEGAVNMPDADLTPEENTTQSNIFMINSTGTAFNPVNPNDVSTTLSVGGKHGLESVLTSYVGSGKELYLVKSAKSGELIANMLEGSPTFNDMVTRWNGAVNILTGQGKTIGNKVLWWAQGESDSNDPVNIANYSANYDTMMASFRNLMGNDIKIVNNEISIKYPSGKSAEINSILQDKATNDANIFMLKNAGYPVQADNAHFTGNSLRKIAGYLYDVITKGDMVVANDDVFDVVVNSTNVLAIKGNDSLVGDITLGAVTGIESVTLVNNELHVTTGNIEGTTTVEYTITKGNVSDTATVTINTVASVSTELVRNDPEIVSDDEISVLSNISQNGFRLAVTTAGTNTARPLVKFVYDGTFVVGQNYLVTYDVTNISGTLGKVENLVGVSNPVATRTYTHAHSSSRPYGYFTFDGTQLGEIEISNLSITAV